MGSKLIPVGVYLHKDKAMWGFKVRGGLIYFSLPYRSELLPRFVLTDRSTEPWTLTPDTEGVLLFDKELTSWNS